MNTKPDPAIDLAAVRNEIAAAHEQAARWERSLDQPPTTVEHWTKLASLAGPSLKKALRTGLAHIEIPEEPMTPGGFGEPRFVLEGEPVSDPGKER